MPPGKLQRYMRHGTLVHLRVFEAVARLGSFTRAAEEMHMAQPTVSVHVKKLTDLVGVPLLEQVGKRARLTAAGEEVYAASQRVLGVFGGLENALSDLRGLKAGKLRIATTTAGEYLLPPLLARFVKLHPGIDISLHVSARETVLERLAEDADDLYLLTNVPEGDAVIAHPILPNPLVALAPANHVLAKEKEVPFARFAREPLLVREHGSGTRLAVDRVFDEHALKPAIAMELGSNESIREAMIAGLGVALLYRYALGFDVAARRIVALDVQGLPQDGWWYFLQPADGHVSVLAQTFVDFARREAPRIVEERLLDEGCARDA